MVFNIRSAMIGLAVASTAWIVVFVAVEAVAARRSRRVNEDAARTREKFRRRGELFERFACYRRFKAGSPRRDVGDSRDA
jgi:hypothetical protein